MGKNILEGCARSFLMNLAEGGFRLLLFFLYVFGISFIKDIRRVFMYHGAEHKTINAYEAGAEMTVAGIRNYSRIHPRCGTSFLLIVVAVSIVVFSLAGHGSILWRIGSRIVLLPLVMGISYEIIRGASCAGALGRVLMAPAMSFQYITTREPDESQIEVALASLEAALGKKLGPASEAAE